MQHIGQRITETCQRSGGGVAKTAGARGMGNKKRNRQKGRRGREAKKDNEQPNARRDQYRIK
jgi:hypothetical protein